MCRWFFVHKRSVNRIFSLALLFLSASVFAAPAYIVELWKEDGSRKVLLQKNPAQNIYPGSLLKPFLAAYLIEKQSGFSPEERTFCPGWHTHDNEPPVCWLRAGHRWVDLEKATAASCNVYFLNQSKRLNKMDYFNYLSTRWNFPANLDSPDGEAFIGENLRDPVSLSRLMSSYHLLIEQIQKTSTFSPVYSGMQGSHNYTLKEANALLNENSDWQFILGKTGSTQLPHREGTAFLLLRRKNLADNYAVLYHLDDKMGGEAGREAVEKLIPLLSQGKK